MSAEMVANSERTDVAAIASRSCAALYGLEVLEPNIQDSDNNYTRFVVISREPRALPRRQPYLAHDHHGQRAGCPLSRARALLCAQHQPHQAREPSHPRSLTLSLLFYFDLDCPFGSKALDDLLDSIDDVCESFTYFGSYTEVL